MDHDGRVDAVRRESTALETAMRAGPTETPIPSCPGWTIADLAGHIAEFAGWWSDVLADATGRPKLGDAVPPAGVSPVDWSAQLVDRLARELAGTAPETEIWTWAPDDQSAGFAARRAAHELAIHRFDAQLARGAPEPIAPDLAVDGIDEIFVIIAHRGTGPDGHGETLHLHATDADAEWLVSIGATEIEMRHEHAKADAALRGAVSDLELFLYGRPTLAPLEHLGAAQPVASLRRAFRF